MDSTIENYEIDPIISELVTNEDKTKQKESDYIFVLYDYVIRE
jgi:hypothetical protein